MSLSKTTYASICERNVTNANPAKIYPVGRALPPESAAWQQLMTAINHRLHFFLWEIWETFYRLVNDCCSKETTEEEIYFGPQKAENKLEQMDFICSGGQQHAAGL
jgi:hypothetical protein